MVVDFRVCLASWSRLIGKAVCLPLLISASAADAQVRHSLPAHGPYNFFNDHLVYIECNNLSATHRVQLSVSLLRDNGSVIESKSFPIDPLGTSHIDARSFRDSDAQSLEGTYGLVRIEDAENSSETDVSCATAFYKPRPGSKVPEYAFVIPFEAPQRGAVWGMYNSIDPGLSSRAVENFISVSNPNNERILGNIYIYDQGGNYLGSQRIDIAGGGRIDYAIGHLNNDQKTGLYSIRLDNAAQDFLSFAARYHVAPTGRHNFGFALANLRGSCNETLLASTMAGQDRPATNWLELGNPNDIAVPVTIDVYDRNGVHLDDQFILLPARSQWNKYLNDIIDPSMSGAVGSVRVTCDPGHPMLAQTTFYGHARASQRVIWAYVSQARGFVGATEGDTLIASVNTFLGDQSTANWLKLSASHERSIPVEIEIFDPLGISRSRNVWSIAANGTLDYDVHSLIGPNFVGTAHIRPLASDAAIRGELVRAYFDQDRSVGTIMPTPLVLTQNDTHGDGCGVVAQSDVVQALEMTSKEIEVSAFSTCAGNLYYEIVEMPQHGTLSGTLPHVTYRATNHYRGTDMLRFRARVAGRPSEIADITIEVASRGVEFVGVVNSLERYRNQLTAQEVRAYLGKIAFGGTPALVNIGETQGLDALVDALLNTTTGAQTLADAHFWATRRKAGPGDNPHSRWTLRATQILWQYLLLYSENPFHERMALLWHTQFATNLADIGLDAVNNADAMPEHVLLLHDGALGNFINDLVNPLLTDLAMNFWLNNKDNHRNRPNQNFARELMELFLLGARDPMTGAPNYSESSIPAATAFVSGHENRTGSPWHIVYNPLLHDETPYRVFEETAGAYVQNGLFTPSGFVEHIAYNHPGSARFIAERIYAQLVNPVATEEVVATLAGELRNNGFEVKPMLRRLLTASANFVNAENQVCVNSPTNSLLRFMRALQIPAPNTAGMDPRDDDSFPIEFTRFEDRILNSGVQSLMAAGQAPGLPPTIFAWEGDCGLNRDMNKAQGEAWLATQLLLERHRQVVNLMNNIDFYFTENGSSAWIGLVPEAMRNRVNPNPEEARSLAQHLMRSVLGLTLSPAKETELVDAVRNYLTTQRTYLPNGSYTDRSYTLDLTDDSVVGLKIPGALQLITSHLQYLLQ